MKDSALKKAKRASQMETGTDEEALSRVWRDVDCNGGLSSFVR